MLVVSEHEQLPVREARSGDAEAWNALFKRYQLPLYSYVFELLHDAQLSLDVVQETFINAARHIAGLRDDAKFGSWLFGIAHQKCAQLWRKGHREEIPIDPDSEQYADSSDDPAECLMRQEQEAAFIKTLDQLPTAHRSALLLHFVEEFSLEEIAAITETPIGTVKSRLHYARKTLKKLLENT
jgi:RNA polymerase sigma-70 factor (ECF subfamily)